jgi:hypothetical protein
MALGIEVGLPVGSSDLATTTATPVITAVEEATLADSGFATKMSPTGVLAVVDTALRTWTVLLLGVRPIEANI